MFLRRRVPENGPLKAAVIGAGAFGHHHCHQVQDAWPDSKDVDLFAIADPNAEMRAKAKAQHGCTAVADWRELLGKVDLVSICSPAITHARDRARFPEGRRPCAGGKAHRHHAWKRRRNWWRCRARPAGFSSVGHQERFVFARTGLLDQTETPLEITCWRRGPWTGRGDDVSRGAGPDDP